MNHPIWKCNLSPVIVLCKKGGKHLVFEYTIPLVGIELGNKNKNCGYKNSTIFDDNRKISTEAILRKLS